MLEWWQVSFIAKQPVKPLYDSTLTRKLLTN